MSVRVLSWALRDAPVTRHSDLLVLIAIADHAHDDGSGAYPGVGTLARMARCDPRTVERALARLQASGVLTVEERPGKTSVYRVLVTLDALPGVTPGAGAGTPGAGAGTPGAGAATPGNGDTDPRHSYVGRSVKNRYEPSGEPRASARAKRPPSESSKVVSLPSAREPYYDRALR